MMRETGRASPHSHGQAHLVVTHVISGIVDPQEDIIREPQGPFSEDSYMGWNPMKQ